MYRLEQSGNLLFYHFHVFRRFETLYDISFSINQEFGEIPLDIRILLIIHISCQAHGCHGKPLRTVPETGESLLLL